MSSASVLLPFFGDIMKLTKRIIDNLSPESKDYFVWDSDTLGFGIRIFSSGRKSYIIQYRAKGRTRRMTIGRHGVLTVDEARKMAKERLVEVTKGKDPSKDKKDYRLSETIEGLANRFIEEYVNIKCKANTAKEYEKCLINYVVPQIGNRKVQDIERPDISKLHHDNRQRPYQANRVLAVLSIMFNMAEQWGLRPDGTNPTRHVKKYPEKKRERFLSNEEIESLIKVMDNRLAAGLESPHVIAAFKTLLLTGCRLGEIQFLKWEYIQGNAFNLPDSKTGSKKVYVPAAVLDILSDLARSPANPYVFIGTLDDRPVNDLQKPWRRIRKEAGIDDVRIHDLRHTFASVAVSHGESLPMIGKLLGHTQAQTTSRYAHLADAPIHEAADRVANLILNSQEK